MALTTKYCSGCRDNFYNGNNGIGVQQCWSLKNAKVVTRWKIGWWTPMDSAKNFTKVKTFDCHHAPGKYALCKELPKHLQ